MEAEGGSTAPALTASMAVDSVHGRSNGTPFPVSSAPEATSPRQRAEPSGQTPDEPPASAQPESGTVTTSSGTPSEFDGGSQQQQGSKDRRKGEPFRQASIRYTLYPWGCAQIVHGAVQLAFLGPRPSTGNFCKGSKSLARYEPEAELARG